MANDSGANQMEDVYLRNRLFTSSGEEQALKAKGIQIFTYGGEGLPLTIPKRIFEGRLQEAGAVVVYEYEGSLFCTKKRPSEKPDANGENTVVHFQHMDKRLTRTIGVDAVLVRNDSYMLGLNRLFKEYSSFMAQAKLTWYDTLVNLRNPYVLHAKDEDARASALEYENQRRAGELTVLFTDSPMSPTSGIDGGVEVHSTPLPNGSASQVIEMSQWMASYYYGEFGVTINNNMKSQYVNEEELQKSTGIPMINDMLECRKEGLRDIEALFKTTITVQTSEAWSEGKVQTDEESVPAEDAAGEAEPLDQGGVATDAGADGADGGAPGEDAEAEDEAAAEAEGAEAEAVVEELTATKAEVVSAAVALGADVDISAVVSEEDQETEAEEVVEEMVEAITEEPIFAEVSAAQAVKAAIEKIEDEGLEADVEGTESS